MTWLSSERAIVLSGGAAWQRAKELTSRKSTALLQLRNLPAIIRFVDRRGRTLQRPPVRPLQIAGLRIVSIVQAYRAVGQLPQAVSSSLGYFRVRVLQQFDQNRH